MRAELPGILAWAVRGAPEYYRHGLTVPVKFKRATQEYREEMDEIGEFIAECCDPTGETKAKTLYGHYRSWCQDSGIYPASQTKFGTALAERGYSKVRRTHGWLYVDIGLRNERL